ncbi:MAG TPA: NAD(P)H-dependent glycerol-3-phosphate dehydrogenase [Pseudolabrys sp.]|nr:NAD(P)H-dependent glycerol-3-phosphate dehydrogenase [Pseudolabrys sp.]
MSIDRIGVIGGGAWGTALAQTAARAGRRVTLWEYDAGNAAHLAGKRESKFLPGVKLNGTIAVTVDLADVARNDAILLVVPAQAMRATLTALSPVIAAGTPLIACAKGIERGTHKFMTEIVAECAPNALPAILSGPSFAADVARGMPTAVTIAAADAAVAEALAHAMNTGAFRPYHSTDVRGVELGGATKNVLAIAAGIVSGRGLGASALAAMTTRGFAELVRFGRACGARTETMMGLSGLGDLILTCGTPQSRNFSYGVALGKGEAPSGKLAEGAFTAPVLLEMARATGVDMPISEAVAAVLAGAVTVDEAIEALLTRPLKSEE